MGAAGGVTVITLASTSTSVPRLSDTVMVNAGEVSASVPLSTPALDRLTPAGRRPALRRY